MKHTLRKVIYFTAFFLTVSINLCAQEHKIDQENSQISITGTSNIHDWAAVVETFEVSAKMQPDHISDIYFEAIVKSIKSGKSGMDKNMYKALKADQFAKIEFKSKSLKIEANKLLGHGTLTIAGQSKDIEVTLHINKKDPIIISGTVLIKMTDYGVTPPTAVFGTITTGDEIKLEILLAIQN